MKINKIAVLDNPEMRQFKERHAEILKEVVPEVEVILAHSVAELRSKTGDVDALLMWREVPEELVEFCKNAPSLKWVHAFTTGVDTIMNSEIRGLDVRITSTKGIHGYPMADHALAIIFAQLRGIPLIVKSQERKEWNAGHLREIVDETINKTVGIVGLGNIGMHLAKRCKALGMRVVAVKRTPIQSEWVDECYATADLDKLLVQSDFVVLVLPLTSETYRLIGEKQLRMMKRTGYLINFARGDIVDDDALIKALREGVIGGAALDIFTREPLPSDSPLWDAPNIFISPHCSPHSPYYMDRAVKVIAENLGRLSKDEEPLYEADKARGY